MSILLSIKPEYAEKILDGTKKYELRKSIFKKKGIKKIVVYSSSPVRKIVGDFEIEDILMDDIDTIWKKTKDTSCVSESFFYEYFKSNKKGYAIKIGKVNKYDTPKSLNDLNISFAPQSFVYL